MRALILCAGLALASSGICSMSVEGDEDGGGGGGTPTSPGSESEVAHDVNDANKKAGVASEADTDGDGQDADEPEGDD